MVGNVTGYGGLGNSVHVVNIELLSSGKKKEYIKKLWKEDFKKYTEWKEWCIEFDQLPSLFGTSDHPIPIDESKL